MRLLHKESSEDRTALFTSLLLLVLIAMFSAQKRQQAPGPGIKSEVKGAHSRH